MSKKASLAELMGATAAEQGTQGLRLSQLGSILGDAMPELPRNAVGRHRLIRALQQRFGPNFRSLPGVMDLVREFDARIDVEKRAAQISSIRYQRKGS